MGGESGTDEMPDSMRGGKIGVALGSGSARGWAHLGVLHALEERGIRPEIVTGASVGALVAAAHASNQVPKLEDWVRTLTRVDVWRLLDATFRGGGVMRGNRLMHAIGERIEDRNIEDLPVKFGAVAADLDTGEEIWLRSGSMLAAVRASSGMPGLFTPMWHQDRWMIDGGVVNPVPISLCRALGADYVIAVNLNVPVNRRWQTLRRSAAAPARKEPGPAEESAGGNWAILEKWNELMSGLVDTFKGDNEGPGLFEVMASSTHIMQDHIARSRMAGDPPNLTISPDLGHFLLMDFHRADEAIAIGRAAADTVAAQLDALAGDRAAVLREAVRD